MRYRDIVSKRVDGPIFLHRTCFFAAGVVPLVVGSCGGCCGSGGGCSSDGGRTSLRAGEAGRFDVDSKICTPYVADCSISSIASKGKGRPGAELLERESPVRMMSSYDSNSYSMGTN